MAGDDERRVRQEDVESTAGKVRIITLSRAAKRNALDTTLLVELAEAFADVVVSRDVRAVVLAADGPSFSAGGDMSEFEAGEDHAVLGRARLMAEVLSLPSRLPVPVIAALRGNALGAGAALGLSADVVVAGADLTIGFPELPNGALPAFVMPSVLGTVPRHVAFHLFMTGRRIGAEEAMRYGLVNCIAVDDVVAEAVDLAIQYASVSPHVADGGKKLFYEQLDLPYHVAIRTGLDALVTSMR